MAQVTLVGQQAEVLSCDWCKYDQVRSLNEKTLTLVFFRTTITHTHNAGAVSKQINSAR